MTINNPDPLIVHVGDTGAVGKYGAKEHYEAIKGVIAELKKVDGDFEDVGLCTDNEKTMKSVRRMYRDDGGIAVGCGSHGVNKSIGMFTC